MSVESAAAWQSMADDGTESRFQARQAVIARAARGCFERKGVTRTSIADITREVNITRELFYYYFDNKAAVIDAVIDSYKGDLHCLLERAVVSGASLTQALTSVLGAYRMWLTTESTGAVSMGEVLREAGAWEQTALDAAVDTMAILREAGITAVEHALRTRYAGCAVGLIGAVNLLSTNFEIADELLAEGLAPLF